MVKYLFEFYIKNEFISHFKEQIDILKKSTIIENGCILFDYLTNKNCFIIIEYWENEKYFNKHLQNENLLVFREKTKEAIIQKRDKYEIIQSKES